MSNFGVGVASVVIPLLYLAALGCGAFFLFVQVVRFVQAQSRIAAALEKIARKLPDESIAISAEGRPDSAPNKGINPTTMS